MLSPPKQTMSLLSIWSLGQSVQKNTSGSKNLLAQGSNCPSIHLAILGNRKRLRSGRTWDRPRSTAACSGLACLSQLGQENWSQFNFFLLLLFDPTTVFFWRWKCLSFFLFRGEKTRNFKGFLLVPQNVKTFVEHVKKAWRHFSWQLFSHFLFGHRSCSLTYGIMKALRTNTAKPFWGFFFPADEILSRHSVSPPLHFAV